MWRCHSIAWSVAERQLILTFAVAIGGTGCIDLAAAECSRHGEGICTNLLNPCDVALVVVQLIADATVGETVVGNDGDALGVAPCVGCIVVGACTAGTLVILVTDVFGQVDAYDVAIVTSDGAAVAVNLEFAAVVDDKTVDDVGTSVAPADDTAAVGGCCTLDGELGEAVLDHCTLIAYADDTAVGGIACYGADHVDVNVAATDCAAAPSSDAAGILLVGGNGTLHLQVLDEGACTDVAEQCHAVCAGREDVDGDGVSLAVEGTLVIDSVLTNHGTVGASVNVSRQDSIGTGVATIHELGKGNQVFCRTDLIDTVHFGECPCSCGDEAQQSCHTQIQ